MYVILKADSWMKKRFTNDKKFVSGFVKLLHECLYNSITLKPV